ncbi:Hypothetical protein I596_374 [Dokdonella koreensis DS-123]|uniref:Uncharacterized protein n=1 Tax=Dokdonella koreensis DS-123 TaxID=1300342 RepID=A0A167GCN4_9GAMM|nr:Hypothetical protein I596_374 [Dokdonella koreensis DS-123]
MRLQSWPPPTMGERVLAGFRCGTFAFPDMFSRLPIPDPGSRMRPSRNR